MGLSLGSIYTSASWSIYTHSKALSELQEQAATGNLINRPSDNPMDSHRILALNTDSSDMERNVKMLNDMMDTLTTSSLATQNITGAMTETLNSLTSGSTSPMPDQYAEELNGFLEDIFLWVNMEQPGHQGGYYLFGGEKSDVPPYVATRDANGEITHVTYQGSSNERNVEVVAGVEMSAVLVGEDIFKSDNRQTPVFSSGTGGGSTTGADVGSTASTVRGDIDLIITSLGGTDYSLSIDGGASSVTIDTLAAGADDVAVTNSVTGEILYVDATGITSTGTETEKVRVPGTYDIFNILMNTRDLLRTDETSLPPGQWDSMINESIGFMHDAQGIITKSFPTIGGRIGTLNTLKFSTEDIKINADAEVSRLQDADIAQLAMDLARHDILYQMSLSVASKMFSLSLLDFIG